MPTEMKFKTELCKNFSTMGKCNYGKKCRFAHGREELVDKLIMKKTYRTKKCKVFFEEFTCPYGSRCHFIHDDRNSYEVKVEKALESGKIERPLLKSRLQIFQNIASA